MSAVQRAGVPRLTLEELQQIRAQALQYVVRGGGIVPDCDCGSTDGEVSRIAESVFGADALIERVQALRPVGMDEDVFMDDVWPMVNAFIWAGFTFGAAVGQQMSGGAR